MSIEKNDRASGENVTGSEMVLGAVRECLFEKMLLKPRPAEMERWAEGGDVGLRTSPAESGVLRRKMDIVHLFVLVTKPESIPQASMNSFKEAAQGCVQPSWLRGLLVCLLRSF